MPGSGESTGVGLAWSPGDSGRRVRSAFILARPLLGPGILKCEVVQRTGRRPSVGAGRALGPTPGPSVAAGGVVSGLAVASVPASGAGARQTRGGALVRSGPAARRRPAARRWRRGRGRGWAARGGERRPQGSLAVPEGWARAS